VRSDSNNTHRSTKDDSLPEGRFSFDVNTEALIKWHDSNGRTARRYLNAGPSEAIKAPDAAVVGEDQIRLSADVRVGIWWDDGGWLVLSFSTEDASREEHERAVERSEGSVRALRWSGGCRAVLYWNLKGEHRTTRFDLSKETMEGLAELSPDLPGVLSPRRFSGAYRSQGHLHQLWLPL